MDACRVNLLKKSVLMLLVAASLICRAWAAEEVRVAAPAPAFELKNLDGRLVKSTNFNDKALIVLFWLSSDDLCRKQLLALTELQKDFGNTDFSAIGIALDAGGPQAVKAFVEEQKLAFPILMADYEVVKDFGGLDAVPTLFVIDKNYNIIHKYVGLTEKKVLEDDLKLILKK